MDYTQVQASIVEVARRAGETIMSHFERPVAQAHKQNSKDIVTEADKAAEAVILSALTALYPDHHFVGEESGGSGADIESAPYRWYIDPIDGTTNFANGIPQFSVSIAMTDHENNPLVGVVYSPTNNELFSAIHGQGATLNGKPIHVSQAQTLQDSVLASGFAYARTPTANNNLAQWTHFLMLTRDLRRFGSAALDLCWVACGRFDGYWEMRLNLWDIMAGVLIVREAGGMVSDYAGDATTAGMFQTHSAIVASNGHIHPLMLDGLRETGAVEALTAG